MAMRLRVLNGVVIALCAAEHDAQAGDLYLDDAQDHAIRVKLYEDWSSEDRAIVESRDKAYAALSIAEQRVEDLEEVVNRIGNLVANAMVSLAALKAPEEGS